MERRKSSKQSRKALPPIPDKRLFTIGEVSFLCDVKPHVLRYWEQEFPQLSPSKRQGNRRCYQHKEVLLVRQIRSLLYEQGFTVKGAVTQLTIAKQQAKQLQQEQQQPQQQTQQQPVVSQYRPLDSMPLPIFMAQPSTQANSSHFLRSSIAALISDAKALLSLLEHKKALEEEVYF